VNRASTITITVSGRNLEPGTLEFAEAILRIVKTLSEDADAMMVEEYEAGGDTTV